MFQSKLRVALRIISTLALAVGVVHSPARADDPMYYNYSFSGTGLNGSGTVGLVSSGTDGVYNVTSLTGQVNGMMIGGLLQAGVYKNNDNVFNGSDPYLDGFGVSFDLQDGSTDMNIYFDQDQQDYFFQDNGQIQILTGTGPMANSSNRSFSGSSDASQDENVRLNDFEFSPADATATTPEPSGLMLLGTGVLATAGMVRRRFKRA